MYEVDNRYPEVAEPYEKIRGVKHHGAIRGGRNLLNTRRAVRINHLKHSFWTSAVAVVLVIALLLVSPGEASRIIEPGVFREPAVTILSAAQSEEEAQKLEYRYRIELKDADRAELYITARTEDGELLGEDGPFYHEQTEDSPPMTLQLSRTESLSNVRLELVCTYMRDGAPYQTEADKLVPLRPGQSEPVTEPGTEPVTEPLTEPTEPSGTTEPATEPTEPFTPPTLTLTEAELDDTAAAPSLRYRYTIELNSAESLRVNAVISSDDEQQLGEDGPFDHDASGDAPARSAPLSWTTRPASLTLTLTGTYTEDGAEKTLTATQTVNVPAEPFQAPTLTITRAVLNGTDVTPLSYRYQVTLNSAESLRVTAAVTSNNGATLGSGGPYNHTASGVSPTRSAALRWTTRPRSVTLTLTGTYTEDGETKTVTASQTLTVAAPETPFTAPTLSIVSASLNGTDMTPLSYSYRVTLNSAENLRVTATVRANGGATLGSGGPYNHTASGVSPTRSAALRWTTRPTSVTLTLTGTYTEKGATKTITATQTLTVPEAPFTAPTLSIVSASLNGTSVTPLSYSYRTTLNSAQNLRVTATVRSNTGATLGSGGPYNHTASGTSPTRSAALRWTTRPSSVTLTLTGTYTEKGTTKTITATRTLPVPEEPFTAPTLTIASAALDASNVTPLSYRYRVTLNSAQNLRVTAAVTSESGRNLGSDGPYTHTASGASPTRSAALRWTTRPSSVTLTLTGTYTEKGATKTITATRTLPVPEAPFTDPTLEIVNARVVVPDYELAYNYKLELNSAELLSISAEMSADVENDLGDIVYEVIATDGPISHSSSQTTKLRYVRIPEFFDEGDNPPTLTLTATYQTYAGETKTLKVSAEVEYWSRPEIYLESADRPGPDLDDVVYNGYAYPGSLDSFDVTVELLDADDELLATDGPFTFNSFDWIDGWSIHADDSSEINLILRLSGSYVEAEGEDPKMVVATLAVDALAPFEAPEIIINSAARSDTQVSCEYELTMNAVSEIEITASYYDITGTLLLSGAPVTQNSGGTFTLSDTDASLVDAARIVLTGKYVYHSTPGSVSDSAEITEGFTAPSFDHLRARLDEVVAFDSPVDLIIESRLDVGDADPVEVSITVVSDLGVQLGEVGPMEYTDSGAIWELISLSLSGNETTLTVTVTGVYDENGTEKSVSDSVNVIVTMKPEYFDSGGEAYIIVDSDDVVVEYWAKFTTMPNDPHASHYDFGVDALIIFWYDGDTLLETSDVSGQTLTVSYDGSDNYEFGGTLRAQNYPRAATQIKVQINISDSSTGKSYTTTTSMIPLN